MKMLSRVGIFLGVLLLTLVMIVIDYSMIQQIYKLLIVPLGAPMLSLMQLIGVGLFLQAIVPTPDYKEGTIKDSLKRAFSKTFTIALIWVIAIILNVVGN
jgi:hypothetical protein